MLKSTFSGALWALRNYPWYPNENQLEDSFAETASICSLAEIPETYQLTFLWNITLDKGKF